MNPHMDEDIMWQRLKDLQREAENRRLIAQHGAPGLVRLVGLIGSSVWGAVHALGLAPRWWSASDDALADDRLAQDGAEVDTNAA
jgi:hypothetical protein